jgi:hypothetical protein
MDQRATQLLETYAKAAKQMPRRTHGKEFNEFIIYVHEHRLMITTIDITEHLVSHSFTIEEARRASLVFLQGSELLLQYDKHSR